MTTLASQTETLRKTPALLLLALLVTLPQIGETIYTPSLTDMARGLNISASAAQTTLSIFFAGFALGVLCWGQVSDHIGRRKTMIVTLALYLLGCLICLSASSLWVLNSGRFIQAFGAASCSVVIQSVCREAFSGERRVVVFTTIGMLIPVSAAAGPFIGGLSVTLGNWRTAFMVLLVLGAVSLVLVCAAFPETLVKQNHKSSLMQILARMLRDPQVIGTGLLIGIGNGIIFSFYAEAPFLLINMQGLSPVAYGTLCMLVVSGSIWGGMAMRRLNTAGYTSQTVMIAGILLLACAAAGLLVVSLLTTGQLYLVLFTGFSVVLFAGFTLLTTACLHGALQHYHDALGTAGALLGLFYYAVITALTEGVALLHSGSALVFPAYALGLSVAAALIVFAFIYKAKVVAPKA